MHIIVVLVAASIYVSEAALPLPPYIKPCAINDPEFNNCVKTRGMEAFSNFVNGDRKYKIPNLNPLKIEEIVLTGSGLRGARLTITMTDVEIYGIQNMTMENVNFDLNKKHHHLEMIFPKVEIYGNYNVSGNILVLPIIGHGKINCTEVGTHIKVNYDYELIPIKGKMHMSIKNFSTHNGVKRLYIMLTNLFNGEKLLENQMNIYLNENWRHIYNELSPSIIAASRPIIKSVFDGLTEQVPFDKLFPEKLP